MGVEPFEAMLNRLKDYGFNINFTSLEHKQQLSTRSVEKTTQKLNKLKNIYSSLDKSKYKTQLGVDISKYEDSIAKAKKDISTVPTKIVSKLEFEYSIAELTQKIQEARSKISNGATSEQKITYNNDVLTNQDTLIDTIQTELEEQKIKIPTELSEPHTTAIQDLKARIENTTDSDTLIELQTKLDIEQTDYIEQLKNFAEKNKVSILIDADTLKYDEEIDAVKSDTIDDKTVNVKAETKKAIDNLNTVQRIKLNDKNIVVKLPGIDQQKQKLIELSNSLTNLPTTKQINITQTTTKKTVSKDYLEPYQTNKKATTKDYLQPYQTGKSGKSKLLGTLPSLSSRALSLGTLSQNKNGANYSGKTLVGELGAEMLVRGNRWSLVGENGAEFVNIKSGDVVFNHLQTQQLMKNERTFTRGFALKDGNAFVGGSDVTGNGSWGGGISLDGTYKSSTKKDKKTKKPKKTKTTKQSKSKEETTHSFDWISNSIQNVEQEYQRLNTILENTVGWDKQKKKQREVIAQSEKLLSTYLQAAKAYKREFNSAAKGVDSKYVELIKSGKKFTIEDFKGDKRGDTYDKISNLQNLWSNYQSNRANYYSQKGKLREENRNLIQIDLDRYSAKTEASEAKLETQTNYKARIKTLKEIYKYKNKEFEFEKKLAETAEERKRIEYEQLQFQKENKDSRIQELVDHYSSQVEASEARLDNKNNYKERIKILKTIRTYKNREFEAEKKLAKTNEERVKITQEQLKYNQENSDLQVEEVKNYYSNKISAKEALLATQSNYKNRIKTLKDILAAKNKEFEAEKKLAKTAAERKQIEYEQLQYQRENAMLRFQEIQNKYEKSSTLNENKQSLYESTLANIEAQGYNVGSVFYERMAGLAEFQITRLEREKTELQKDFKKNVANGKWIVGSDEWYEGLQAIYDVEEAIADCNGKVIEYNNSLRQLKWDQFDRLLSQFSKLNDESDFLINILSSKELVDEKLGGLTQEGNSTNALHLQNYNSYMAQSDKLKSEIDELTAQIEKQSIVDQNLVDRRDELISQRYEMIESAQSEKQSVIDLVTEGYESQISAMQTLTDKNKDLLQKEKERHDYEKQINEKSKSIATLEKQIAALSLSTDRKDIAQKLKLEKELADQKESLEETQYEHSIETQQNALDDSMELYEEKIKNYLKNTDQVFTDTLNHVNRTSDKILSNIESEAKDVGYSISENIINTWTNTSPIVEYGSTLWNVVNGEGGVLSVINTITEAWNKANEAYEKYSNTTANTTISDVRESENIQSKDDVIASILGKSSSSQKVTGSSKLNQYVTGLGYEQLSYTDMANLSKQLGLKTTSANDFKGEWETVKDNYSALQSALEKYMVNNFLDKQEKQSYTKKQIEDAKTTRLNKYLMTNGYKQLTPTEQVKLAQLLGVDGITKDNYSKSENVTKILKAFQKIAGFSQGGEVKSNRYQKASTNTGLAEKINAFVQKNNDDGIATVQRGEVILSGKQSEAFKNFITQYANIQPFGSEIIDAITTMSSSKNMVEPIQINITAPLVHVDSVRNDSDIEQIEKSQKTALEQIMREFKNARTR